MLIRRRHDFTKGVNDGLTIAKLTHECNTKINHREFGKFFDCQRFENAHEVAADVWKTRPAIVRWSTIAYDVHTNGPISIRSHPKLENFLFLPIRVSIGSQHRDSVTRALFIHNWRELLRGDSKFWRPQTPPPQSPKVRPKHRQTIYFWKACKISRFEFMFIFFSRPLGRGSGAKCVFSPLISALQRGLILKTIS